MGASQHPREAKPYKDCAPNKLSLPWKSAHEPPLQSSQCSALQLDTHSLPWSQRSTRRVWETGDSCGLGTVPRQGGQGGQRGWSADGQLPMGAPSGPLPQPHWHCGSQELDMSRKGNSLINSSAEPSCHITDPPESASCQLGTYSASPEKYPQSQASALHSCLGTHTAQLCHMQAGAPWGSPEEDTEPPSVTG